MLKQVVGASVWLALAVAASAQVPAFPEFRINNYSIDRQCFAVPAMKPDGAFVTVWTSYTQDGSGAGAIGRRSDPWGFPLNAEFQINTFTTGFQRVPDVAVGSRGDFTVVWESVQDGSGRSIHGQRYDAAGSRAGAEFQVNTFTPGDQYRPHIGRAADGRFVVAFSSQQIDGAMSGIATRRYDAFGNPLGAELVVNTYTSGNQGASAVAVDADGAFVVVWDDGNAHDGSGYGIFGQRFDAAGVRLGGEFQVNSGSTANQFTPSVSVSPAGGFVVSWTSDLGDGSGAGIFARLFDAAGNAVGSEFVVNTYTLGDQYGTTSRQIAHDVPGNFVVTWGGAGDGSLTGTFAQRFSASGARRGAQFQVNTFTTGHQAQPSVASDAVGNFFVAWDSDLQDGSNDGVFAQRFGGLFPAAMQVDIGVLGMLEPGEFADVKPTWVNRNGSPQTFTAVLGPAGGPPNGIPQILSAFAGYGTVMSGSGAQCNPCYSVVVPDPAPRPLQHWDATALESVVPDTQGQQKLWRLHIGRTFSDVPPTDPYYRFVESAVHFGVTGGCSATQYCPLASTTRAQMAVFVLVGKEGTGYVPPACGATPMFADVAASNPFCRWIEELARRGVVGGCGGGNYCPTSAVTREQMAVFVLRALEPTIIPPACTTPRYLDVPASSPYCRWIEELTRRNVVNGCGFQVYCPTAVVTRQQMAVFIAHGFGHIIYRP